MILRIPFDDFQAELLHTHRDSKTSLGSSSATVRNYVMNSENSKDGGNGGPVVVLPNSKSHTRLISHHSCSSRRNSVSPQQFHRRLAPMLLGVSFCWVFFTSPQTILHIVSPKPSNISQTADLYLIKVIFYLLMYLNHAVNFFLYCITGQRFRHELKRGMFCSQTQHNSQLRQVFLRKDVMANGENSPLANGEQFKISGPHEANFSNSWTCIREKILKRQTDRYTAVKA